MHITRFEDAQPYEAPNHRDVRALRLQGFDPHGPKANWVGLSHFLPGGGAGPDASPLEKTYVVLEGEIEVRVGQRVERLQRLDSCFIPGGEQREVRNPSNAVATMLVIMPYPATATPSV